MVSSHHTFSFANYYDPNEIGFSDLLVINDDKVAPAGGFATHPHRDMEIFSYVLQGALEHKDSMGNGSVIKAGDIQMMSAGTGITHSEFNHYRENELVHFLQIWIVPDRKGVQPRYKQIHFDAQQKRGKFCLIISPNAEEGSLPVWQDLKVYAGLFDANEQASFAIAKNRYAYIHVVKGQITINGISFQAGDGARVINESSLNFSNGLQSEILVFDLRPHDLPNI